MNRPSAGGLFGFLILVLAVQAALLLGKGVLLLDQHEGDALHILQIVLLMDQGQWPHLDFMTPLGVLAFAPITWLMSLGLGPGHAILGGFVLFAALVLPAAWWAGLTRLPGWLAYGFGAIVIVLCTALVYGGSVQVTSISMYYNRWAWAVAFVVIVMAVLPPKGEGNQAVDGLILGLGLSFLALAKITFFVAFLPGVLLALALRRQGTTFVTGLAAAVIVVGLVTLAGGIEYWAAYISDLREIRAAPIRSAPGDSLSVLLSGPSFLAANLCLLAGIIMLRQAGNMIAAPVMMVFAPAFVYATYQNWGNDPKWLIVLAVVMLAARPERHINNTFGWDVGRAMGVIALLSFALVLPSVVTLTLSDIRHARLSRTSFAPVLPGAKNADIMMKRDRMFAPAKRFGFFLTDPEIMSEYDPVKAASRLDTLFGQPLEACKLMTGFVGVTRQIAYDLDKMDETHGKSVFVADTFSSLWLFGKTVPVKNGAPWYYGGDAGMTGADYVLIPLCPVTYEARSEALKFIAKTPQLHLKEIARNEMFILLRRMPDQI